MRQLPQARMQYFQHRDPVPVFGFVLEEPAQRTLFEHPDAVSDFVERHLVVVR